MSQQDVVSVLREYVSREILDGEDIGLEGSTPLLEWGIINSMEIARLVVFLQDRFEIEVPSEKITIRYFKDLDAIASLVAEQRQG